MEHSLRRMAMHWARAMHDWRSVIPQPPVVSRVRLPPLPYIPSGYVTKDTNFTTLTNPINDYLVRIADIQNQLRVTSPAQLWWNYMRSESPAGGLDGLFGLAGTSLATKYTEVLKMFRILKQNIPTVRITKTEICFSMDSFTLTGSYNSQPITYTHPPCEFGFSIWHYLAFASTEGRYCFFRIKPGHDLAYETRFGWEGDDPDSRFETNGSHPHTKRIRLIYSGSMLNLLEGRYEGPTLRAPSIPFTQSVVCLGEGRTAIHLALGQRNLLVFYDVFSSLIKTYNEASPYTHLYAFLPPSQRPQPIFCTCANCQTQILTFAHGRYVERFSTPVCVACANRIQPTNPLVPPPASSDDAEDVEEVPPRSTPNVGVPA